ncbi:sensor histidine kinase regulating citrate/malate metabolism [Streptomyces olivoverticillatus]|uniref:histidine kinase n=1 Tax=Streptomyces olivoverticillatus TaxID=66427 RepID=A0A7W7PIK9_9ACTN|nr:sensor histidine kinase [Streptomyces olivoverticillatus]MBB4891212.1 sensor histidine kinase regulating citrate/malate metabolism [Streptomyces olivoverticillatus]
MRIPRMHRPRSLAGRLFAVQIVLVTAVVAGCAVFAYLADRQQAEEAARRQVTATAATVAASAAVRTAVRTADPTTALQPYAEDVRHDTGVDFVTIMSRDGIRWTHPDPARIGARFLGHTGPALQGRTFSETYTGTLGPSVRAVAPVREPDGTVTALVSAGITVDAISAEVGRQVTMLIAGALAMLAAGGAGTYLLNARLRRQTHGMNAAELARMRDYHEAALHAVREGLLMLDGERRIALVNDGARELLGLPDDAIGRPVDALGLPPALTAALLAPGPRVDEVHLTAERTVVLNTSPVSSGERRGTVVTLRDHTELQALSGELDSVRGFAEALRSQAHEAANRLHAVVSLIELGRAEEAVEFATAELELAQALTDRVVAAVAEPVLAALLLGKAAQANEHGVELVLTEDTRVDDALLPPDLPARDLVTILGNLIDNAVDAATDARRTGGKVTVTVLADGGELLLRVGDTGPGVAPESADEVFARGWSTKEPDAAAVHGRGLGLALVRQAARRNGGSVALGRSPSGGAEFTVRLPLPARRTAGETV